MPIPAAQYLRMSTEHQQYSLANQALAISMYAVQHDFAVTTTYSDEGRSGLVLRQRPALQQLLRDVVSSTAPYRAILVYDVSRWGRFQDADESAHYEFMCRSAGVPVHYCAETFTNDTSGPTAIMKALKRTMASEYSRELSAKVYAAQRRISEMGYRTGGKPGYGFRRMLISSDGSRRQMLNDGERKAVQTDRVILVHGPSEELTAVREIYRMVIEEHRTIAYITRELNRRRIPFTGGGRWYDEAVNRILNHRKYCGDVVFGTRTQKLHSRSSPIPRERWVISRGRHDPIVDSSTFELAQTVLRQRTQYLTNEQLLEGARRLLQKRGTLNLRLIDDCPDLPSHRVYLDRFGSFWRLCQLLRYENYDALYKRTKARLMHQDLRRELMEDIVEANRGEVFIQKRGRKRSRLRLRDRTTIAVTLCRPAVSSTIERHWYVARSPYESRRLAVLALLSQSNNKIERTYVARDLMRVDFTLWEHDIASIRAIPFDDAANFLRCLTELRCDP